MRISEDFFSIQGEGPTMGVPAYFVRLQHCNLICGGRRAELLLSGRASWYCDTERVWREGKEVSNNQLIDKFQANGQLENILDGTTHIIWTGGEPTLPNNVRGITEFLDYTLKRYGGNNIFSEIETNGTVETPIDFYRDNINQINCSPKLANSGMSSDRRINPKALNQIIARPYSYFKFVVSKEEDVLEAQRSYIHPFKIPKTHVYLMPGVDKLGDLSERTRFVYDMAKKYNYRATTRGQVLAWDRTTGV